MMIACPNCATSYEVNASTLGATGRSVRCVRCRNIWFVHDPGALSAIAQAHRSDVEAFAGSIDHAEPEDRRPDDQLSDDHPHDDRPTDHHLPDEAAAELVIDGGPTQDETSLEVSGQDRSEPTDEHADEHSDEDPLPHAQEPIEIADAPTLAPMEDNGELPADAALEGTLGEDAKPFVARRARRRESKPFRWPLPGLPVIILTLVALNAALIGWRADVVRLLPQTASLYAALGLPVNLRGLTFGNVTTAIETQDGVQVLVVEGTIASAATRAVEVPRLRFSVRNNRGQEVYAWTALPTRGALSPGETLPFRSRLASPPPDMREVLVRFFNRRDLAASAP